MVSGLLFRLSVVAGANYPIVCMRQEESLYKNILGCSSVHLSLTVSIVTTTLCVAHVLVSEVDPEQ